MPGVEQPLRGPRRRRFAGAADFGLALRVAAWLWLATLASRLFGLPRVLRWLAPRPRGCGSAEQLLARARRVQRHADGWMRRPGFGGEPICWKRALVILRLVPGTRPGQVRMIVGVAGQDAGLQGHAWIEIDGVAVDGTPPLRYRSMLEWPPASSG